MIELQFFGLESAGDMQVAEMASPRFLAWLPLRRQQVQLGTERLENTLAAMSMTNDDMHLGTCLLQAQPCSGSCLLQAQLCSSLNMHYYSEQEHISGWPMGGQFNG